MAGRGGGGGGIAGVSFRDRPVAVDWCAGDVACAGDFVDDVGEGSLGVADADVGRGFEVEGLGVVVDFLGDQGLERLEPLWCGWGGVV